MRNRWLADSAQAPECRRTRQTWRRELRFMAASSTGGPRGHNFSLDMRSHHHHHRILDQALERAEQLGAKRAVDRPVVGRERPT